jgi:Clostridial hydrophobic W
MSQAERKLPAPPVDARVQELKSSAHLMTLETGIYCLVNGSILPKDTAISGVRVSPTDPTDLNVSITSFRSDGWLNGAGDAALIKVLNGPAQIMVTIYQPGTGLEEAPKIRVLRLSEPPAGTPAETPATPVRRPVMVMTEPHDVIAHVQRTGDVGIDFGEWVGTPGSQCAIEGFSLTAPTDLAPGDLTYQAVLGRGWLSPWSESGQFCGSRGMALPLLGLKVKLSDAAAKRYSLTYEATFIDGSKIGPVESDESCETDSLSPLEAMRVMLVAKAVKKVAAVAKPVAPPAKGKAAPAPKGKGVVKPEPRRR